MTIIVQQPKDSSGNPQPMVYDSDTGKIIVDSNGYVLNGGQRLVNVPSRTEYVSTPKTQTTGIQEAINYIFNIGGGVIYLIDGTYDITNAPFTNVGFSNYSQLTLPQNDNTSPVVNIAIIGNPSSRGGIEGGEAPDLFTGGATIYSGANPTDTSNSYGLFMVGTSPGTTNLTNINLYMDGIHFQTAAGSSMNGFNGFFLQSLEFGRIYVDTDAATTIPTSPNTTVLPAGFTFPGGLGSAIINGEFLGVVNYYYGVIIPTSHVSVNKIMVDYCVVGMRIESENYASHIGAYDVQNTSIHIQNEPTSGIPPKIKIDLIDMGDQQTSGVYQYKYSVNDTSTSTDNGGMVIVATLSSYQATPAFNITQYSVVKMKFLYLSPTSALPANPPASGTVYQNTNPYNIEIDLPAYATTSGTAGYVTVAKGSSSSSLTTIGNQFVNGSTSSTSVDIIRLRVPAGWYYEFTASGVTFGTASVFAD